MKKNNVSGFTLPEVLIAAAISAGLFIAGAELLLYMNTWVHGLESEQSLRLELGVWLQHLSKVVQNIAILNPAEDLLEEGDVTYRGFAGSQEDPSKVSTCRYEKYSNDIERYSILRLTTIANKILPEKTLRLWNESNINSTNPKDLLRVTFNSVNQDKYLFSDDSVDQQEIMLLDADGLSTRRYGLKKIKKITTNLDPYDDLPKKDKTGKSIDFTYFEVMPTPSLMMSGNIQKIKPFNFITNSLAYTVKTRIVCVDPDGRLIETDDLRGNILPLLDPRQQGYRIERFAVQYYSTKKNERLEFANFLDFPKIKDKECINALNFRLLLVPVNPKPGIVSTLEFTRPVLLTNFENRRLDRCR